MSETPVADEAEDETEGAEAASPAKPKSKKKKLAIIGAAVLLLAGGGGGSAYMFLGSGEEHAAEEAAEVSEEPPIYVEVPPLTVNLRTADGQTRFLKVRLVLVPADAEKEEAVRAKLPLILDAFQPFLRELRPEDLAGSAAVYRLKEELILRSASVLGPDAVGDVLVQDLIQQ